MRAEMEFSSHGEAVEVVEVFFAKKTTPNLCIPSGEYQEQLANP